MRKNVRAWVEALRKDDAKQARGALTKVDSGSGSLIGHCCLGVACTLVPGLKATNIIDMVKYGSESETGLLPEEAQKWLGVKLRNPWVVFPEGHLHAGMYHTLVGLNDGFRYSLKEIADIIEAQPRGWKGLIPEDGIEVYVK